MLKLDFTGSRGQAGCSPGRKGGGCGHRDWNPLGEGSHLGVGYTQDETDTLGPAERRVEGYSWLAAGRPGRCRAERETEVAGTGLHPEAGAGAGEVAGPVPGH